MIGGGEKDAQRSMRSVGWRPFMTLSRMAALAASSWVSVGISGASRARLGPQERLIRRAGAWIG
jgi:hypothetical protein